MRVVNDRRTSPRVIVRGDAFVHMSHGVVRCECVDLSVGGMLVMSPKSARPRHRAFVETSFGGHSFHLPVVVVRRKRTRGGYLLGLRFTEVDERMQATLDEIVRTMQVQSVLAQQACVFFERLPRMEVPESEPQTEPVPYEAAAPPAPYEAAASAPQPVSGPPVQYGQSAPHPAAPQPVSGPPVQYGQSAPHPAAPQPVSGPPVQYGQSAPHPAATPYEQQGQYPASAPSAPYPQAPGQYPASTPSASYPQAPGQYPASTPSASYPQAPGQYPASTPSAPYPQAPGQYPASTPSAPYPQAPGQYPASTPSAPYPPTPGQYPASTPSAPYPQAPGQYPASTPSAPYPQAPGQYPASTSPAPYPQAPGQYPASTSPAPYPQAPGQYPASTPSAPYPPSVPVHGGHAPSGPYDAPASDSSVPMSAQAPTYSQPAEPPVPEASGYPEAPVHSTPSPYPPAPAPAPEPTPADSEQWDHTMVSEPEHWDQTMLAEPEHWDGTMMAPSLPLNVGAPSPSQPLADSRPIVPFGVDEGWTEDELDTQAFDPLTDGPLLESTAPVAYEPAEPPVDPLAPEMPKVTDHQVSAWVAAHEPPAEEEPEAARVQAAPVGYLDEAAPFDPFAPVEDPSSPDVGLPAIDEEESALDFEEISGLYEAPVHSAVTDERTSIQEAPEGPPTEDSQARYRLEEQLARAVSAEMKVGMDPEPIDSSLAIDLAQLGTIGDGSSSPPPDVDRTEVDASTASATVPEMDYTAWEAMTRGPSEQEATSVGPGPDEDEDDDHDEELELEAPDLRDEEALVLDAVPQVVPVVHTEVAMIEPSSLESFTDEEDVGAGFTLVMNIEEMRGAERNDAVPQEIVDAPLAGDDAELGPARTGATQAIDLRDMLAHTEEPAVLAHSQSTEWSDAPAVGAAFDIQEMMARFDAAGTEVEVITPDTPPVDTSAEPEPEDSDLETTANDGPRLRGDLQAALNRLRRRSEAEEAEPKVAAKEADATAGDEESTAKQPARSSRRRRRPASGEREPARNDSPELVALYRQALADLDTDAPS